MLALVLTVAGVFFLRVRTADFLKKQFLPSRPTGSMSWHWKRVVGCLIITAKILVLASALFCLTLISVCSRFHCDSSLRWDNTERLPQLGPVLAFLSAVVDGGGGQDKGFHNTRVWRHIFPIPYRARAACQSLPQTMIMNRYWHFMDFCQRMNISFFIHVRCKLLSADSFSPLMLLGFMRISNREQSEWLRLWLGSRRKMPVWRWPRSLV